MMIVYRLVTTYFKGVVVATLPFDPPGFMQRLTHANLEGTNMRECAGAFDI